MSAEFNLHNPMRDPRWRAERVLTMLGVHPPLRPRKFDDAFVRRYRAFVPRFTRAPSEEARMALFTRFPEIYYAHQTDYTPDTEWKAILQSRILTGETDEEVAHRFATLPGVITWYERLFFNVRDRLTCHDWVVKSVLGTAASRIANTDGSHTEYQRDLTYKLFGYFGGPMVLDVVISGFVAGELPSEASQIPNWFDKTLKTLIRSKATAAARLFEVNKYNIMQLFEIQLGIMNTELQPGAGDKETSHEKNIAAMMNTMPWGLLKRKSAPLSRMQREYSLTSVEPRAQEQLQLAVDQAPDSLVIDAKQFKRITVTDVED